jgi:hypothetical protein
MKHNGVISTAVLFLILGITIPALAQNAKDDQGVVAPATPQVQPQPSPVPQEKDQPQPSPAPQAQRAEQPTRAPRAASKAQPPPTPQAQPQAQPQPAQNTQALAPANNADSSGNQYGRISNASYSAYFGQGHSFHMMRPQMIRGYNRFQYGGYWFGFNHRWPLAWNYGDTCYVVYNGGAYYLHNLSHPGIRINLSMF